ncbi:hypothetical protein DPMN_003229 [Dreissena polymorpha]|uniref:Uncharacterized protein n=1 Tax=Dreissena polymorpha TaxID=45954 RepID=A0A9D4MQ87_DREPO|nr:hypothetical protein DPMN_003229 [Dreissena polymorpha]
MKGSTISKDISSENKRHWLLGTAPKIVRNGRYRDWERSGAKIGKPPLKKEKKPVIRHMGPTRTTYFHKKSTKRKQNCRNMHQPYAHTHTLTSKQNIHKRT